MQRAEISEIISLAKRYDSLLNRFETHLKNILLFKLYESPDKVLPDYQKRYYKNALNKKLISLDDMNNINYWRDIRNELIHKKPKEITFNKLITFKSELIEANEKINYLIEKINLIVEAKDKEEDIIIFNTFNEFRKCDYACRPTLFLYTPNSPKRNPNRIFNLYIIGDRKGGKSSIFREFVDPKSAKQKIKLQIMLSQILTIIYDHLRPTKFKRIRNLLYPFIRYSKDLAAKKMAINYYSKTPIPDKFRLIIHETNILSKIDLIRTDMYKGQIVGIIFTGFERNSKPDINLTNEKFLNYYSSVLETKIKNRIKEFNYEDYYFCPKRKAIFYKILSSITDFMPPTMKKSLISNRYLQN